MKLPDFIMIGAMKCATSTLHEQLARQPRIFMSTPKEPSFFSDDDVWSRGAEWYGGLFAGAPAGALCGESSTHYTKRSAHPETIDRMRSMLPGRTRFIYVMRHPVDRLVSHYVHEWSSRRISGGLDDAVERHPELLEYGCYAMQLRPYIEAFGRERILPVFFARLTSAPQAVLDDVAKFLGGPALRWEELPAQNAAGHRQRLPRLVDRITDLPGATALRRALLPERLRRRMTRRWRLPERPRLSATTAASVTAVFDEDLATLGAWLGLDLSCSTFDDVTRSARPRWAPQTSEHAA